MDKSIFHLLNLVIPVIMLMHCGVSNAREKCDSIVISTFSTDSVETAHDEMAKKTKLHKVLISWGATVPFHKSMLWQMTLGCDLRIYKNVFIGLTFECEMQRFRDFKEYTDTLSGASIELSVKAFSNPIFCKKNFSIGLWGDIGVGRFGGRYLVVAKDSGDVIDEEALLQESYLKFIFGLYFKYRCIYATVGYHVNNLELKPYGEAVHSGLFRKPSLNGLSLMLRFGI